MIDPFFETRYELVAYPTYKEPSKRFTLKELAQMQSKGKYLTPDEKNWVVLYAAQQRKRKACGVLKCVPK